MPMLFRVLHASLWLFLKTQPPGVRLSLLLGLVARSSDEWLHCQQDVELLATVITDALRDHYAELPGG